MSDSLSITDSAALKIKALVDEEQDPELGLRIHIEGGGCSGYKYEFSFDKNTEEDDIVIQRIAPEGSTEVRLLVDVFSMQLLGGSELDYKSDLEGERFIIRNPNAKTTCGCGSSFDV